MSYVSIICDCDAVQRVLPQFLIGNQAVLKIRDMPDLLSVLGPTVKLLRRKSAWVNEGVMLVILRQLHTSLIPFLDEYQPILLFDAAPPHTTPMVFRMARRLKMWPLTIPARLTWLLQPLDTHGFLSFKRRLEQIHQAAQIGAVGGEIDFTEFLRCVCSAIAEIIMHGSWAHAFERNGFGDLQARLSQRVRAELGSEALPACSSECPTLEQVACCFPKRFPLTAEIAFGPEGRAAVGAPLLLRARIPLAARPSRPSEVIRAPTGRTRSGLRVLRTPLRSVLWRWCSACLLYCNVRGS